MTAFWPESADQSETFSSCDCGICGYVTADCGTGGYVISFYSCGNACYATAFLVSATFSCVVTAVPVFWTWLPRCCDHGVESQTTYVHRLAFSHRCLHRLTRETELCLVTA